MENNNHPFIDEEGFEEWFNKVYIIYTKINNVDYYLHKDGSRATKEEALEKYKTGFHEQKEFREKQDDKLWYGK